MHWGTFEFVACGDLYLPEAAGTVIGHDMVLEPDSQLLDRVSAPIEFWPSASIRLAPTIPDSLRTLGFASLLLLIGFGVRALILRDLDREMLDSGI